MQKFLITNLILLLLISCLLPTVYADESALTEITDEDGNVPAYTYYPSHVDSRAIKVLKSYDGKIFMGLGNWNDNTGPVKILYYDTIDGKVKTSGTIADEAVQQFTIINDNLYTTGCDPRSGWGTGSYYVYNKANNNWEQHQNKGGWIHIFNIVEFKNKLYICGSTEAEAKTSNIQSSDDNGETFKSVPVFKDGTQLPYENSLRCYNLVVYNNKLYGYIYASPYTGIYEYNEEKNEFHYISSLPSTTNSQYGVSSLAFYNTVYFNYDIFNNKFIYVSGNDLYTSTDLKTFNKIKTNTKDVVQDVVVSGDTLYTLSYAYNSSDKTFTTRIYKTKDLSNFNLVYEFNLDSTPGSIEYLDNNIYVGTGNLYSSTDKNTNKTGALYKIDTTKIKQNTNTNNNVIANTMNNTNTLNNTAASKPANTITNNNTNFNGTIDKSTVNNFVDNNSKLPQTGNFFEFKNLLQIIIIISTISLIVIGSNKKH